MNNDEYYEQRFSSADLIIIDFFCLPDELQNFDLTDEMACDIEFYEAMGRDLANQYGYGSSDADFPEGCENW